MNQPDTDLTIGDVLISDDHELIMIATRELLTQSFATGEIAMFTNPEEALLRVKQRSFDLYILDLEYKEMSGFELIKKIRKYRPEARIIVNTLHDEIWNVNQLMDANVNGIVLKKSSGRYLQQAVESIVKGEEFLCPQFKELKEKYIAHKKKLKNKRWKISPTERVVLKHIAAGNTSKEIAELLSVAEDTIESHRKNLFIKLEARNAAHLTSIAIRYNLIE